MIIDLNLKNKHVLVHSDSTAVRELTGLKWADSLDLLKNCFLNILGNDGTLIVPTFNWDFCKGKPYVHEKTRSQVGMFTNFILSDELSIRSFHPIYSFAGIGPASNNIFHSISEFEVCKTKLSTFPSQGNSHDLRRSDCSSRRGGCGGGCNIIY